MKVLSIVVFMLSVLTACNLQEGIKDTGDGIQGAVDNLKLKEAAKGIADVSNEAVDNMKE